MARPSNKRQEIYDYLVDYVRENGYGPSIREICSAVGLASTATVYYHLTELKRRGMIDMDPQKKRTITIPDGPKANQIPVVGVVTAGLPILAVENIEGYLPWEGDPDCFALRVRGDSMMGAGILSGDRVVVRPQPSAENGEIVVALLGDEATVKRLRIRGDAVLLMPENPAYKPIDGRFATILGVVRALYREYP